jgi:hypothetical protein
MLIFVCATLQKDIPREANGAEVIVRAAVLVPAVPGTFPFAAAPGLPPSATPKR